MRALARVITLGGGDALTSNASGWVALRYGGGHRLVARGPGGGR
jgi:hypothetical protein